MGVNIWFNYDHAQAISKSIETATYAMYDNSPDDSDYLDVLHKVAKDLRYVKDQLDHFIEAEHIERRLGNKIKEVDDV
jgi:hypothetical protein